jgi:integration host factor subunit alpha
VEELLALLKETLASGEDLLVSGFGKFSVRDKGQRRGRNPWTGDDMMLPPRRVVTFKGAGNLRRRFNGTGDE